MHSPRAEVSIATPGSPRPLAPQEEKTHSLGRKAAKTGKLGNVVAQVLPRVFQARASFPWGVTSRSYTGARGGGAEDSSKLLRRVEGMRDSLFEVRYRAAAGDFSVVERQDFFKGALEGMGAPPPIYILYTYLHSRGWWGPRHAKQMILYETTSPRDKFHTKKCAG